MPLVLYSPAFADGERIPEKYTRGDENLSPPLRWSGAPEGTRSFVLIVEDPDAPGGTFYHWAVFNMPADRDHLPESVETGPGGAGLRRGQNDFGNAHYDGPEPPPGSGLHHYHFRLAALSVPNLTIPAQAGIAPIWREARKHLLDQAELVGVYGN
jgi:Raf kinase inhibitor-like YbhB/YbcL family protein